MLSNSEIGLIGESYARDYLQHKNYQIIACNWRFKRAEIDLIAIRKQTLVFVEVKTRSYTYFGQPEEFITENQINRIFDASQRFLEKLDRFEEIRYDIVSVILNKQNKLQKISHFKDAFFN